MSCYICASEIYIKRPGSVRDNPDLKIHECTNCGLVFLSSQQHITEDHYKDSGMHAGQPPEIDNWLKDTKKDDQRRYLLLKEKIKNKAIIDFGCGVGGFIEMAKNSASMVSGIELESALQESFNRRNLSVYQSVQEVKKSSKKWDIITAFHVVEHLRDPLSVLIELSSLIYKDGEIIIEVPNSEDALLTLYNNQDFQNFTYWSQHLFLFNESTIRALIAKGKFKLNWIQHVQRYPLVNHLHWLSNGKPAGEKKWPFMDDGELNKLYEAKLAEQGLTDTIILSFGLN